MKFSKLSLAALVAFAMVSGSLLADDSFTYKGYMRIGTQWVDNLNTAPNFGQGGAQKWSGRLGNEYNTRPTEDPFFLEQEFVKNFQNEANNWAKVVVLMNYHGAVGHDSSDYLAQQDAEWQGNTFLRIRQAYVEMGGLGFSPDMTFWVGKKFLNRDDVHVLDWYFLDFSGTGLGVTNIANLGIDFAFIRTDFSALEGNGDLTKPNKSRDTGDGGVSTSNNFVFKFENKMVRVDANIKYVPKNKNTVDAGWGTHDIPDNYTDYMGSIMFKPEKFFYFLEGSSKVFAQYATGSQANCMWFANRFTNNTGQPFDAWANDKELKASAMVFAATGVATIGDNINIQPVVGYRSFTLDLTKVEGGNAAWKWTATHYFAAARATYSVTPNLGFALEAGYSSADQDKVVAGKKGPAENAGFGIVKADEAATQLKITPALILTMDSSYYTRPQIRLYGVYTSVSEGYKPTAGPWKKETSAMWYGAQAEAWW